MKFVTGLLAAVLLLAGVGASHAAVLITEDRGGRIGAYMDKYQGLRSSGETVVIDGFCASACTIILAAVPHDKICVTSYANLGFHAAWDFGPRGRAITNREATQMLYSMYPSPIRRWIAQRGGLTVNKRPKLTPPSFGISMAWLADRRRDPTPINITTDDVGKRPQRWGH
jgi:hypothetical protein